MNSCSHYLQLLWFLVLIPNFTHHRKFSSFHVYSPYLIWCSLIKFYLEHASKNCSFRLFFTNLIILALYWHLPILPPTSSFFPFTFIPICPIRNCPAQPNTCSSHSRKALVFFQLASESKLFICGGLWPIWYLS